MNEKAEINIKAGEWAEREEYYDVAVNRYYYSIYQKLIFISKAKQFYEDPSFGEGSHKQFINAFFKKIINSLNCDEIEIGVNIQKLRKCRNTADYSNDKMNKNNYYNDFKKYYGVINNILDKMIVKENKNG